MIKHHMYHTHLNPKKGDDEPLYLTIEGPKESCSDCRKINKGEKMTGTIYEQLFSVAQTQGLGKQKVGESDSDHLKALVRAINKVDETSWNKLSAQAQTWYNEAVIKVSAMKEPPSCPGFVGLDATEKIKTTSEPAKGMTATEILKAVPPTRSDVASKVQASQPATPKAKKKTTGVMDALRRIVIIHPDWTSRQVYDYLRLNGFPDAKLDTISVDGGNIRRVIELAKELGYWREAPVIVQPAEVKEEVAKVEETAKTA